MHPALDAVSSTATQLLTCLDPLFFCQASLTMMSDIIPPQLTCCIHLQSYWVAVFLFLEQHVVSVSTTCLLLKETATVINTIIYLYLRLDPLIPGSPGTYT